jgi:hypothetical protein
MLEYRNEEYRGFACSGLGLNGHIFAFKGMGKSLFLHGHAFAETRITNPFHQVFV